MARYGYQLGGRTERPNPQPQGGPLINSEIFPVDVDPEHTMGMMIKLSSYGITIDQVLGNDPTMAAARHDQSYANRLAFFLLRAYGRDEVNRCVETKDGMPAKLLYAMTAVIVYCPHDRP